MTLVTFRCLLTGETQTEILCDGCADVLAPLPSDSQRADDGTTCTTCPKAHSSAEATH